MESLYQYIEPVYKNSLYGKYFPREPYPAANPTTSEFTTSTPAF
jgi:hypothetical protein